MSIDECASKFKDLARFVLPNYMRRIRGAMEDSRPLAEFCEQGVGVRTIVKKLGMQDDFSGCYVLLRRRKPFYVGISRGVVGRLRQHGRSTTHFDASLAYRMASKKVRHNMTRAVAMQNPGFRKAFEEAKRLLTHSRVAFIEIRNSLELHLFETYCAMELDTHEWNTFRTH